MKFRVSFCWNDGKKRGIVQSTCVIDSTTIPDFFSLLSICAQKLRPLISKSALSHTKIYVKECPSKVLPVGFELTSENTPGCLLTLPSDGLVLAVSSSGAPFSFKKATHLDPSSSAASIPLPSTLLDSPALLPPFYPLPGASLSSIDPQHQLTTELYVQSSNTEFSMPNPSSSSSSSSSSSTSFSSSNPVWIDETPSPSPSPSLSFTPSLHAPFPRFPPDQSLLKSIRHAISGSPHFVEKHFDHWISFDYAALLPGMFDGPFAAIRRELRGLLICPSSGTVLARRFHKFFNLHEHPDSHPDRLPGFSAEFQPLILEKIDGTLVSPVPLPSLKSGILWASRAAPCLAVEAFLAQESAQGSAHSKGGYLPLIARAHAAGFTPLFEWLCRSHTVGVITAAHDALRLLAFRHVESGEYLPHSQLVRLAAEYAVPCARQLACDIFLNHSPLDDASTLLKNQAVASVDGLTRMVRAWSGVEGVVVRWETSGQMVKLKTDWYVALQTASKRAGAKNASMLLQLLLARPTLHMVPVKHLWDACLDPSTSDDLLAHCIQILRDHMSSKSDVDFDFDHDDATFLQSFANQTQLGISRLHQMFIRWGRRVASLTDPTKYKEIMDASQSAGWTPQLLSAYAKGGDHELSRAFTMLHDQLRGFVDMPDGDALLKQLLHTNEEENEHQKEDGKEQEEEEEETEEKNNSHYLHVLPPRYGEYRRCSKKLKSHVLESYLKRKIANFLGVPAKNVSSNTLICIPPTYSAEEGKIAGLWEPFRKEVLDLRIDLQPPVRKSAPDDLCLDPFTDHCGNAHWALWLVQYGANPISGRSSKVGLNDQRGSFAGVCMQTGATFRYSDLLEAMTLSFANLRCIQLSTFSQMSLNHQSHVQDDNIPNNTDIVDNNNHIVEGSSSSSYAVFCDLDGVLADFERGLRELAPQKQHHNADDSNIWKTIGTIPKFFASLEMTPQGPALWRALLKLRDSHKIASLSILTGIPTGSSGKSAKKQKRQWCKAHLSPLVPEDDDEDEDGNSRRDAYSVITCLTEEKPSHARPHCILIDDRLENGKKWAAADGLFIHHIDGFLDRTLWRLAQLLDPSPPLLPLSPPISESLSISISNSEVLLVTADVESHPLFDAFSQAVARHQFVAFDLEWRPDEMVSAGKERSAAALLQIAVQSLDAEATSDQISVLVFIVDLLAPLPAGFSRFLLSMLEDPSVLKCCFDAADFPRLFAALPGLRSIEYYVDLQGLYPPLLGDSQKGKLSLTAALQHALPSLLGSPKSTVQQISDWAVRPLTPLQVQYAADDAKHTLLLALLLQRSPSASHLLRFRSEHFPRPSARALARYAMSTATQSAAPRGFVLYSGVFLDDLARRQLLARFPPRFPTIAADHITLKFKPSRADLDAVPVGQTTRIEVLGYYADHRVDCVRVRLPDYAGGVPANPHITLSCAPGATAKESNNLLAASPVLPPLNPPFVVEGKFGFSSGGSSGKSNQIAPAKQEEGEVVSDHFEVLRRSIPNTIVKQIIKFLNGAQEGQTLRLSEQLSSSERFTIHEWAEIEGLQSRSEGPSQVRRLILTVPRGYQYQPSDSHLLSSSSSTTTTSTTPTSSSLLNELPSKITTVRPLVVIMRGIPGAGKSTWVQSTFPKTELALCSADLFFERGAGILRSKQMRGKSPLEIYQEVWSADLLDEAHTYCKIEFQTALTNRVPLIVVDNTNIKLSHLNFYRQKAIASQYHVVVIEIECPSEAALKICAAQGSHALSFKTLLPLWRSFEPTAHLETSNSHLDLDYQIIPFVGRLDSTSSSSLSSSSSSSSTTEVLPSLSQFIATHNLLHHTKNRRKTHLIMATGEGWRKGTRFLDVPDALMERFWKVYLADETHKFIAEMVDHGKFRLFFDLDDDSCSIQPHLQSIVQVLQSVIGDHRVLVSSCCDDSKTGFHLRVPSKIVSAEEARQIRQHFCRQLSLHPTLAPFPWAAIVDEMVYIQVTLRMYGSRKATKGCDMGRIHQIHAVFDQQGQSDPYAVQQYQSNPFSWLQDASIRSSR